MNLKNKESYSPEATEDAWKRIFTFLKQELTPPPPSLGRAARARTP